MIPSSARWGEGGDQARLAGSAVDDDQVERAADDVDVPHVSREVEVAVALLRRADRRDARSAPARRCRAWRAACSPAAPGSSSRTRRGARPSAPRSARFASQIVLAPEPHSNTRTCARGASQASTSSIALYVHHGTSSLEMPIESCARVRLYAQCRNRCERAGGSSSRMPTLARTRPVPWAPLAYSCLTAPIADAFLKLLGIGGSLAGGSAVCTTIDEQTGDRNVANTVV